MKRDRILSRSALTVAVSAASLVAAGALTGPATAAGPPTAPTAVAVRWGDPTAPATEYAVRVAWQGDEPTARYHVEIQPKVGGGWTHQVAGSVTTDTGATTADLDVHDFPYGAIVRIAVVADVGGASSTEAYSPVFDTDGPRPQLTRVVPNADGTVTMAWTAGLPPADATRGDPLDVDEGPASYQPGMLYTVREPGPIAVGEPTQALTATINPLWAAPPGSAPIDVFLAPVTRWRPTIERLDSSSIAYSPARLSAVVPARNVFGVPFTISGRVDEMVPVCDLSPSCELEAWAPGRRRVLVQAVGRYLDSWVTVASSTTDVDGMINVRVPAEGYAAYRVVVLGVPWTGTGRRWVAGSARSYSQNARTSLRVVRAGFVDRTAQRGQKVTARLRVTPSTAVFLGPTTLQRRSAGRWVAVARISLVHGKGAFTFRARHRGTTRYRFLVPTARYGQQQYVDGVATRVFTLVTR